MPKTYDQAIQDPTFYDLPPVERKKVIAKLRPEFSGLPSTEQDKVIGSLERKYGSRRSTAPPPKPPSEGILSGVGNDLSIGLRSGVSHLEKTVANASSLIPTGPTRDFSKTMREKSERMAPKPEELQGRDSMGSQIVQGIGSAVPGIVEYAPAMLAKKYAPIVAGAIGTISEADKGAMPAASEGFKQGVGWWLMGKAGQLPTRLSRAAGSAVAMGLPSAVTGGDAKEVATSAALGGMLGAVHSKATPKKVTNPSEIRESLVRDLRAGLSPMSLGDSGKKTGIIIKHGAAELYQRLDQSEYALRAARNYFDKTPYDKSNPGGISKSSLDFISAIEKGRISTVDPKLKPWAQEISRAFEQRRVELQKHGLLDSYVENYFPHLWTRPQQAQAAMQAMSKRPLEGGKRFLRQRTFATVEDGINYAKANPQSGMELISSNPIDIALVQLREMDKLITAKQILGEMKQSGLLKFVRSGQQMPPGYDKINDKFSTVQVKKPGSPPQIVGHWYAPSDAAQVMNNYLSPGLRDKPWFRGYLTAANSLNQFQLGFSAFHLGFTTIDAGVSQFALGVEQAVHGVRTKQPMQIAKGLTAMVKSPVVPFEPLLKIATVGKHMVKSNMIMKEWDSPGSHPQVAPLVKMMKQAGARIHQDPFYRVDLERKMKQAFRAGKFFSGAAKTPSVYTEKMMKWLFEYMVPMQKIGAFSRLAEFEMGRLPQNATESQTREVLQKAWASIDNRMGQLVYDNLLWKKGIKDVMMASVRSVGWNIGTFRELGGGGADTFKAISNAMQKKPVEFTHKMAYLVSMPFFLGTMGMLIHKINTGKNPQTIEDYYFPQTGKMDANGHPQRISMPSYIRDVAHVIPESGEGVTDYAKKIGSMASGKLHPMIATVAEMIENRDWRDAEIRNEGDPWMRQLIDLAEFAGDQVVPFSFRYSAGDVARAKVGGHTRQYSPAQATSSFFGFTPASPNIDKAPYEKATDRYLQQQMPKMARTKEMAAKASRVSEMERAARADNRTELERLATEGMKRGQVNEADVERAEERSKTPPGVRKFKAIKSLEQQLEIYSIAAKDKTVPPEEMNQLHEILMGRVWDNFDKIQELPAESMERQRVMQLLKKLKMLNQQGEVVETEPPPTPRQ